ncbi:MAG: efflux RND transporter periplasmic adaptor subunit, partial [Pyrinomonadaceae bacterium]
MASKRRRWRLLISLLVLVLCLGGAIWGISKALRSGNTIDPSKLATVERGNLARSVVATGKI